MAIQHNSFYPFAGFAGIWPASPTDTRLLDVAYEMALRNGVPQSISGEQARKDCEQFRSNSDVAVLLSAPRSSNDDHAHNWIYRVVADSLMFGEVDAARFVFGRVGSAGFSFQDGFWFGETLKE